MNGHIGFNEPGTPFESRAHVAEISGRSLSDKSEFYRKTGLAPRQAVTLGIRNIMEARKIILVAKGAPKLEVMQKALFGPVTPEVPASILQLHPDTSWCSMPVPPGLGFAVDHQSIPADAKRIGDAVDVIEPRGDQRDLEYSLVVKSRRTQGFKIYSADAGGVLRQLHHVIQHHSIRRGDGRIGVVLPQRADEVVIESHGTQKLCVGFDSIHAPVRHRNHCGDHLVLSPRQGQFG